MRRSLASFKDESLLGSKGNKRKMKTKLLLNWMLLRGKARLVKKIVMQHVFAVAVAGLLLFVALNPFATLPCMFLCSWKAIAKPRPPPYRSFQDAVTFVRDKIQHGRLYSPIEKDTDLYNVFDCPPIPPENYPREYPIMDVLANWAVPDTELKDERFIHQGLCVFDYASDAVVAKERIRAYQKSEVPFIVRNDPTVLETVQLWNTEGYLQWRLQTKLFHADMSKTKSMMYWRSTSDHIFPPHWTPPTRSVPITFEKFLEIALAAEDPTKFNVHGECVHAD